MNPLPMAFFSTSNPTGTTAMPEAPVQMIALGLIILAAHLGGKLCERLRLSEVTGQLVGGALVGPYALQLMGILTPESGTLYANAIEALHFFIFVFLSVVAFGIGEELHQSRLKKVGKSAVIICLIQAGLTWLLISSAFYFITKQPLLESLLIGSIGIATAPAVTFVLMNKLRIEGRLRHILGSLVVLDDLIEVIIFSFLLQFSLQKITPEAHGNIFGVVLFEVLMALLIGGAIYLVLRLLVRRRHITLEKEVTEIRPQEGAFLQRILSEHPSPSVEILLLIMGTVSLGAGLAYYFHWPFLITATFAGFLIANFHSHAIFDSLKIDNIMPMLNLGFFALIGASIDLSGMTGSTILMSIIYIITRMAGKTGGTWLGCIIMKEGPKIKACLPRLMLPQAGVAAVESVYAGAVLGNPQIAAIILPAIVFFEVIGVFLVDHGLRKWRSWVAGEEEEMMKKPAAGPHEAALRLLEYIGPQQINLRLKAKTKAAILEELVDLAIGSTDQHVDRVQALQVLAEREELAPTGFGHGIAIPHCRLMGIDKSILVFGRHDTGVAFGGVDNAPSDIFLLMLTCARDPGEHLKLLSSAAHIFGDTQTRAALRKANSASEVCEILNQLAGKIK
ncbi:cation:proton antiporter [bacterium]|nr:cation:proton antiporter [bacterium]